MIKKQYSEGSFGAYLVELIQKHNLTQTEFTKQLNISKTYLFDVLNGRVKPPTPDMQDRIVVILKLSESEKKEFYTISAKGRDELPKDIYDYLKNNTDEIQILRERMECYYGK